MIIDVVVTLDYLNMILEHLNGIITTYDKNKDTFNVYEKMLKLIVQHVAPLYGLVEDGFLLNCER